MLPAFLTAICFAFTAVSARQSASLIGPLRANAYRLGVAILLLGLLSMAFWKAMTLELTGLFALAGGIGFGLGGACMMRALQHLGSPRALLFVESGTAVLAALFAWLFLEDTLSLKQTLSCGIILAGILFAGSTWIREETATRGNPATGYVAVAGAALFQSISLVLSRHAFLSAMEIPLQVNKFNAAFIRLAGGLLVAGLLVLIFKVFTQGDNKSGGPVTPRLRRPGQPLTGQPFFWVFLNALFGPVLGVTCWLWAVSLLNPGVVQSIAATAPLISIPVARMLERHSLGIRFYIGAPVAILGITTLMLW